MLGMSVKNFNKKPLTIEWTIKMYNTSTGEGRQEQANYTVYYGDATPVPSPSCPWASGWTSVTTVPSSIPATVTGNAQYSMICECQPISVWLAGTNGNIYSDGNGLLHIAADSSLNNAITLFEDPSSTNIPSGMHKGRYEEFYILRDRLNTLGISRSSFVSQYFAQYQNTPIQTRNWSYEGGSLQYITFYDATQLDYFNMYTSSTQPTSEPTIVFADSNRNSPIYYSYGSNYYTDASDPFTGWQLVYLGANLERSIEGDITQQSSRGGDQWQNYFCPILTAGSSLRSNNRPGTPAMPGGIVFEANANYFTVSLESASTNDSVLSSYSLQYQYVNNRILFEYRGDLSDVGYLNFTERGTNMQTGVVETACQDALPLIYVRNRDYLRNYVENPFVWLPVGFSDSQSYSLYTGSISVNTTPS